ncbi:MAG: hypothetical protein IT374_26360 [Polyangiaceae bacterium]|nr:hypothetical protein [Polyangiaceae bacterium]
MASAPGWVAQRAGSIVGFSAALSAAITGAGLAVAVAKDTALHTFAAGDNIDVVYTSTGISNTPVISAWVEIEQ